MLRGICVNELHHSCEMMAQLGKQKCKVWQFKRMCFVSVCKQHLGDSICIKAKVWKHCGGFRGWGFSPAHFYLTALHPHHAPTGTRVETLWQGVKLKLLNRCFDVCLWARSCVCVRVCVSFSDACMLTKVQTAQRRAASRAPAVLLDL